MKLIYGLCLFLLLLISIVRTNEQGNFNVLKGLHLRSPIPLAARRDSGKSKVVSKARSNKSSNKQILGNKITVRTSTIGATEKSTESSTRPVESNTNSIQTMENKITTEKTTVGDFENFEELSEKPTENSMENEIIIEDTTIDDPENIMDWSTLPTENKINNEQIVETLMTIENSAVGDPGEPLQRFPMSTVSEIQSEKTAKTEIATNNLTIDLRQADVDATETEATPTDNTASTTVETEPSTNVQTKNESNTTTAGDQVRVEARRFQPAAEDVEAREDDDAEEGLNGEGRKSGWSGNKKMPKPVYSESSDEYSYEESGYSDEYSPSVQNICSAITRFVNKIINFLWPIFRIFFN